MRNVIVGTAGHVDHGKTSLIQALTGVDTDRLKEEKRRGITIDLGFAEMPNDRDLSIGVVDVPGHEKFIGNMLAGIGGIDLVLLVIAADESVMPQTAEHVEILKALRISRGIIALTKTDLAEEEWLEIVREDIKDFVRGTFLEQAPLLEVSVRTGQNVAALKELICDWAEKAQPRRDEAELFRVPVDRVFTIGGFGTIVTGTLIEGAVAVGEEVSIYPSGKTARVRNLQVHGKMTDTAVAGQRTALNLTGIKKEEVRRGDVLAAKGAMKPAKAIDVKIEMFADSPRRLRSGSRLHLHIGSAEVLCKATLLDSEGLESGQSGFARLQLEEAIAVRKGDRFILRFYSPPTSIGGGVVLRESPPKRKRFHGETLRALSVLETGDSEGVLEQILLEESGKLTSFTEIKRLAGLNTAEAAGILDRLSEKGRIVRLSGEIAVHRHYWEQAQEKAALLLQRFHDEHPLRPGMPKEEFRSRLGDALFLKQSRSLETLIGKMVGAGAVREQGHAVALPAFGVVYTPDLLRLKDKIEDAYKKCGSEAPETEEILSALSESEQGIAVEVVEALRREGRLEKLTPQVFIHADHLAEAAALLRDHIRANGQITLSEFRDMLGTSRKYAVRILEYMDQKKVTQLVGDARVLIG